MSSRWMAVALAGVQVALALAVAPARAAEPRWIDDLRSRLEATAAVELEWAVETGSGDTQKVELQVEPELDLDLGSVGELTLLLRFGADGADRLEPGQPDGWYAAAGSGPRLLGDQAEVRLRELYLETEAGPGYVTVGKQQIVWGTADGLRVLDVINPQSFREFILDELSDARIPLWALNAELPLGGSTLQIVWVPDTTVHALPETGAAFELTSPLLVPRAPPGVPVTVEEPRRPGRALADSDAGLRLSAFVDGWDLTLNYLYRYDDFPAPFRTVEPGETPRIVVRPGFVRTHLVGGTFSNAFGNLTVRGEVAYTVGQPVPTADPLSSDGVARTDALTSVVGLDWYGFRDTLVSVQLFQDGLVDPPAGRFRRAFEQRVSLLARRSFLADTLEAEVLWLHDPHRGDGLARPVVRFDVNDRVSVRVGADLFYGDPDGLFGQFDGRDRVTAAVELGFD